MPVEAYHQQRPLVQQAFLASQTQNILPAHNPQALSQGVLCEEQYYQPPLSGAQALDTTKPSVESLVTYQQQQPCMTSVYYSTVHPQQEVVEPEIHKMPQPQLTFQSNDLSQPSYLAANQAIETLQDTKLQQGHSNLQHFSEFAYHQSHKVTPHSSQTESVLKKHIGHEPCIHTLTYLEAQLKSQKQITKSQREQLTTMWEQSAQRWEELQQLKLDCSAKDKTIEALRSQVNAKMLVDSRKEVSGLRAVIKEQREDLEVLHQKTTCGQVEDMDMIIGYPKVVERSLNSNYIDQNHKHVEKLEDEVSRMNLNQRELSKLQEENENFRLDIGRLERENSELNSLRMEITKLKRRLLETSPLHKIPFDLDQSVSSTGSED